MTSVSEGGGAASLSRSRRIGALLVLLFTSGYYWLYVLAPRLIGQIDPDRSYHLALSRMIAEHGLLRSLPQVEDIGWGAYFPEKEFLFHALSGAAYFLGGEPMVLALVPLLGTAIVFLLYLHLSRVTRPYWAALLAVSICIVTAAFMFRLSLLRPHLLAILFFCTLLVAVLEQRGKLAALAAAGFALSYHAFYVIGLVAGLLWLFRKRPGFDGNAWLWCLAGLGGGILLNPYFPSNVGMGLLTLKLALGSDPLPFGEQGLELARFSWMKLGYAYGYIPAAIITAALAFRIGSRSDSRLRSRLLFLVLLAFGFLVLGAKSPRAMEYAVPVCILMVGYAAAVVDRRAWIVLQVVLLVAIQGYISGLHYYRSWRPAHRVYDDYALLLQAIPKRAQGAKVFNCEWEAGSYILRARPDLRFVVLLEPALLWNKSKEKYAAMQGLIEGAFDDPHAILRGAFKADYVICAAPPLIRQMDARPSDFSTLPGSQEDRIRLFAVRPD